MTTDIATAGVSQEASLEARCRVHLMRIAALAEPVTYKALAVALAVRPPNSIHQVTEALEALMLEDALRERPFIAALVVSRARDGLPAPGFFDTARRLGRFDGASLGEEAWGYFSREFANAVAYWSAVFETRADAGSTVQGVALLKTEEF